MVGAPMNRVGADRRSALAETASRHRAAAAPAHAPEGAGERADVGEAHENRRDAHRQRADDQRGEWRAKPPAAWPRLRLGVIGVIFPPGARAQAAWRDAAPSLFSPQRAEQGGAMDADVARTECEADERFRPPSSAIAGALDAGVLVICDHARNALPPDYGDARPAARGAGAPYRLRHRRGLADAPPRRQARRAGGALDLLAAADRPQSRRRRSDSGDALFRRRDRARQCADRRGRDRAPPRASIGRPIARRSRRRIEAMLASRRAAGDCVDPFVHADLARRARGRGRSACCGTATRACRRR